MFASVSENGTVQLWDVRRQDRCQNQFTAHHGPIFACDWHPEVKTWLATAGRDKAVKIWDLGFKNVLEYSVTTMASVGRIKWRPQRMYHIASCALVIDSSIHVWDIRRPYIPHASFNDHKDITTGIAWRGSPDVLLSTSKVNSSIHSNHLVNFLFIRIVPFLTFDGFDSLHSIGFVPNSARDCRRREANGKG